MELMLPMHEPYEQRLERRNCKLDGRESANFIEVSIS